jgi:hypothetical protein
VCVRRERNLALSSYINPVFGLFAGEDGTDGHVTFLRVRVSARDVACVQTVNAYALSFSPLP